MKQIFIFVLVPAGLIAAMHASARNVSDSQAHQPSAAAVKPGIVHFEDIARYPGITMQTFYGSDTHKEFIIETTGNGSVVFDYDNDGWPDIFLPNGSTVEGFPKGKEPTGHLYHNNHDGTFTDVTQIAGLAKITRLLGWGVQFFDFDNSGWPGLFMSNGHVYPEVDGKGLGASYCEPKMAH